MYHQTCNAFSGQDTALYYLPDYYDVIVTESYKPTVGVVINNRRGGVTSLENSVMRPRCAFTGFGERRSFREDFIHETVGHGFGWLGDEYVKYGSNGQLQGEIPESQKKKLRSEQAKGWFLNLSLTNDPKSVNWSHLIGYPRYPYVGVYEGGYYYSKGVWKSETSTIMAEPTDYYFNTICRELIVKRTLEWGGEEYSFEKFLAKDSDEGRPKSVAAAPERKARDNSERRHQPPIFGD